MRLLVGSGAVAATPPPVPVTNLALASATSSSLTLSFTAPPAGSIVWNVRRHGTTTWAAAAGAFSSSQAVITGLASATAYDVQAIATNNGGTAAAELDNVSTAAVAAVVPAPTPTAAASRYDLVTDQSQVAPGGTITGGLYSTSGIWSGGTATIKAGSGPSVTVSLPSSGNAKVAFSVVAPSTSGTIYVTSTNTAGLRPGQPAPVSVFTPSSGTVATVGIGGMDYWYLPQFAQQKVAWSGTPTGWTPANGMTFGQGWGRLKLPLNAAVPALFGRLFDFDSAGATTTAGTGTAISGIAQIYGATTASQVVDVILPASDRCMYLDIATDAAFTNPVRFSLPFFVRDKVLVVTRSQMNMLLGGYAEGIPGNTNWSSYVMGSGIGGQNPDGGGAEANGAYIRINGVNYYGNNGQPYGGVGAQEIGRLHSLRTGSGYTIAGEVPAGQDLDHFWNQDGSPKSGVNSMLYYLNNECRSAIIEGNGWSALFAPESVAAYKSLYANLTKWLLNNVPSLSTVAFCSATGVFGSDGSRATGYTRQNQWIEDLEAADPCIVSINASSDWNDYYSNSGHASWASAIRYARASERAVLLAAPSISGGYGLGHSDRFCSVGTTGTIAAGSGQIRIPINLVAGATAIVPLKWTNGVTSAAGWTYTTPTSAELACLWAVYQGSGGTCDSGAALVTVSSVTISGGYFVLTVPSSTTGPLTAHFLSDYGRNGPYNDGVWFSYFDNRDPGDGSGYGYCLRSRVDIAISQV